MKIPHWLPRKFRRVERCVAFDTIKVIRGREVTVVHAFGTTLYRAFLLECEEIFFSGDVCLMYFNRRVMIDTTNRIGAAFTVTKCSRREIETGADSVTYGVFLAEGVAVSDISDDLESIWREDQSTQAKRITVNGKVWRSTLVEDLG